MALLLWNYRAAPRGGLRWLCAGLKTLGLCAIAFCLLEPLWSSQRAKPGANLFAVIADNSAGLQIKDRDETRTRCHDQTTVSRCTLRCDQGSKLRLSN